MKNSSFKEIEKIISKAGRILAVSHQGPDGDAIGSLAAFGFYLKKIKKPHYLLCVSGVPESLKFIPGSLQIKSRHPKIRYDLIIGLDYGTKSQLGLESYFKKYPKTPILIFDHHLPSGQNANFGIINPKYSSACELLHDYFKTTNFKINKEVAQALAAGILSDTGFFKYTSDNPRSLEIIVDFMKCFKIKPVDIDNSINGQIKMPAVKLWGLILNRVKHNRENDFVYSWIKRKELNKYRLTMDDLGDIMVWFKNLKEGRFTLLLIEESGGKIRGRLRSRPDKNFNVAELAEKINGGGHKYAAGFRIKGTIDSALKLVAKYARK
ncbi:MAG: bifunctional oligoribonuclease/PAP phosphatase NrnA [Candidatus Azambacteria bacterium]|nr:bifunctional oligoribonuclease/PAP phosphatase NrnA [Candidatus Azambacteria bacterium]